jgi:MoaA/NifB/PqqE/SkfB family radical SAM enzyme
MEKKQEKIDSINKLTFCDLGIAYECNMQCKMCRFWLNSPLNKENVLSTCQWMDVLTQLSRLQKDKSCLINFSGPGEVLLREGVFELIKHGRGLGLNIQVISNGLCVDEQTAQKINRAGLEHICFSLDSMDPETHDYMRGKKDAHKSVLKAIDNIRSYSPDTMIGINTVISNINLDGIIGLVEWVEKNVDIKYINFQAVSQPFSYDQAPIEQWFSQEEYKKLWPEDKQKIKDVIGRLIGLKEKGYKIADSVSQLEVFLKYFNQPLDFIRTTRCNLSKANVLNIDPAGNVAVCQLAGIIGNLKETGSLGQIYSSEKMQHHIEKIKSCQRNCHLVVSCYYDKE